MKCVICGSVKKLEIHHIVPLSKHGSNNKDNLTTLCKKCNGHVGTKIIPTAGDQLKLVQFDCNAKRIMLLKQVQVTIEESQYSWLQEQPRGGLNLSKKVRDMIEELRNNKKEGEI